MCKSPSVNQGIEQSGGKITSTNIAVGENAAINHTDVNGDQITVTGNENTIVNRSTVQNAFNKVKTKCDDETAKALKCVEEEINKSGNKEAAENYDSFCYELSKPEPKKSLLKTLWNGTLAALPTLSQLTSAVSSIVKLFS